MRCMETNKYVPEADGANTSSGCPSDPLSSSSTNTPTAHRKALLRVPTGIMPLGWYDPKYWSKTRPTEFYYGDCVWGLDEQEEPPSISELAWMHGCLQRPKYCLQRTIWSSDGLTQPVADCLHRALPSDEFLREDCEDARDLVIGAAVQICSASCWKYHYSTVTRICRHAFYHIVTLTDWNGVSLKRRRQGKHVYGCMAIC